jgi:hypothetical protein
MSTGSTNAGAARSVHRLRHASDSIKDWEPQRSYGGRALPHARGAFRDRPA